MAEREGEEPLEDENEGSALCAMPWTDGTDGPLSALGYVIQILYLYGYVLRTSTSMFLGRSSVHVHGGIR